MAIQFQLRRGTTVQNNAFVGAEGEITVDTEKHAIRIHDGVTPGGYTQDFVTESWISEDGLSWYRKYASGWVEQGGTNASLNEISTTVISLPVEMADTYYTALAQNNTLSTASDAENGVGIQRTSTTTVTLFAHYINPNTINVSWQVSGMAA